MMPALTGFRNGEVLGLTSPAVDFKANKIHIRLNLVDDSKEKGGRQLRAPKSKSSRRSLNLPQELAHELNLWKLKCPPSEQDLVFATIEGKRLHRKAARPAKTEQVQLNGEKYDVGSDKVLNRLKRS